MERPWKCGWCSGGGDGVAVVALVVKCDGDLCCDSPPKATKFAVVKCCCCCCGGSEYVTVSG